MGCHYVIFQPSQLKTRGKQLSALDNSVLLHGSLIDKLIVGCTAAGTLKN